MITTRSKKKIIQEVIPEETSSSEDEEKDKKRRTEKKISFNPKDEETSEIDEKGNIRGLIDYSDQVKDSRKNTRKKQTKRKRELSDEYSDEYTEEEYSDEYTDSDEYSESEEEKALGLFLSSVFGARGDESKSKILKDIQSNFMSSDIKEKLQDKLKGSSLSDKQLEWFESFLKIPFGVYSDPPIDIQKDNVPQYFRDLMKNLDSAVYGLHTVKEEIVNYVAKCLTTPSASSRILALHGVAGVGKCLDPETPILLFSGNIKKAKNINVGDQLMGDDSNPRNVLSLATGTDKMYRIIPEIGKSYVVNEPHILSLRKKLNSKEILDISVVDYLSLPVAYRNSLCSYNTAVEFPEQETTLDPYILGFLLSYKGSKIIDKEIITYFKAHLPVYDLHLKIEGNKSLEYFCVGGNDNEHLSSEIERYNLFKTRKIPSKYLYNSKRIRRKVLAGVIEGRGKFIHFKNCYALVISSKAFRDQVVFLARSLGYVVDEKEDLVSIYGNRLDLIPVQNVRKISCNFLSFIPKSTSFYNHIKIEYIGQGEYCGFEIDGNRRFLLGDFTVTHNTKIIREGISKVLHRPMNTFSMGGIKDSSHFVGFDFTYMNSKYGAISQILMNSKVMDPIIFLDELDKISNSYEGEEIQNLLVHITDPVQNHDFKDKYFDGFSIDLSRVLFIVAFNDIESINPILKDRLHIINIPVPSKEEKLIIAKNYLIKDLLKTIPLKEEDFKLTDKALEYLVDKYSEGGVRGLKRCIESILLKINTIKLLGNTVSDIKLSFALKNNSLPVVITEENIDKFIKEHNPTNEVKYPHFYT